MEVQIRNSHSYGLSTVRAICVCHMTQFHDVSNARRFTSVAIMPVHDCSNSMTADTKPGDVAIMPSCQFYECRHRASSLVL